MWPFSFLSFRIDQKYKLLTLISTPPPFRIFFLEERIFLSYCLALPRFRARRSDGTGWFKDYNIGTHLSPKQAETHFFKAFLSCCVRPWCLRSFEVIFVLHLTWSFRSLTKWHSYARHSTAKPAFTTTSAERPHERYQENYASLETFKICNMRNYATPKIFNLKS